MEGCLGLEFRVFVHVFDYFFADVLGFTPQAWIFVVFSQVIDDGIPARAIKIIRVIDQSAHSRREILMLRIYPRRINSKEIVYKCRNDAEKPKKTKYAIIK